MNGQTDLAATVDPDSIVLYCPHCEYNLTGLPQDRCPECGQSFDRESLLRATEGAAMPIPGWSRKMRTRERLVAYGRLLKQTMFQPEGLAHTFPYVYSRKDTFLYSQISRLLASLVVLATMVVHSMFFWLLPTESYFVEVLLPLSGCLLYHIWVLSLLTEIVLSDAMNRVAPRTGVTIHNNRYSASTSWAGLVNLNSGFVLVMTCGACGIRLFLPRLPNLFEICMITWILFIVLWWVISLSRIVAVGARSFSVMVLGIFTIFVVCSWMAIFTALVLLALSCAFSRV